MPWAAAALLRCQVWRSGASCEPAAHPAICNACVQMTVDGVSLVFARAADEEERKQSELGSGLATFFLVGFAERGSNRPGTRQQMAPPLATTSTVTSKTCRQSSRPPQYAMRLGASRMANAL